MPSQGASQTEYQGLICRGVEECGRLIDGTPGWGGDIVCLFASDKNPLSAVQSLEEHLAWVHDPLHSDIADGTGGLVVWAHPGQYHVETMLSLPGLAGLEVHRPSPADRDQMWDQMLTTCWETGRSFPWAFPADDTHDMKRIGLSWYEALLPEISESALKQALRAGAFYVSNGPRIEGVRLEDGVITLTLGQESDVAWLRSGQHMSRPKLKPGSSWDIDASWRPAQFSVSPEVGADRCLQLDRGVTTVSFKVGEHGSPEELKFIRAIVLDEAPEELASDVWRLPVCAMTQPWRLHRDGRIDNPYPEVGTWLRGMVHNHTDAVAGSSENIVRFRLAYQDIGQLGAFATDYSYWETPYPWFQGDGTPRIFAVQPDRVRHGEEREIALQGANFAPGATFQLGPRRLAAVGDVAPSRARVIIPADLPVGTYDVVVTNPDGFRHAFSQAFTVQQAEVSRGWRAFSTEDGLPYPHCTAVACVGDDVWIASADGMARYRDGKWTSWERGDPNDPQTGWGRRTGYCLTPDPNGGVWAGGFAGMVFCGPDGENEQHRPGDVAQRWGPLAFDQEGSLYAVNRRGGGIAVRRDGAWRLLGEGDALPARHPTAIACDSQGTLWAGFSGERPLFKHVGDEWVAVPLPAELADCHYVYDLEPGLNGEMWASVTSEGEPKLGGVARFGTDGEAASYLPASGRLPCARIRDILVSSTGEVWFASDLGLARLRADREEWETFTTVNSGLGCSIVLDVAEDAEGNIWCATARGVSRLSRPRQEG